MCCEANGMIRAAELVDHVVPHKGDEALFWEPSNWQSLCQWCDKHIKRVLEHSYSKGKVSAELLKLSRPMPEHFPYGGGCKSNGMS